MTDPEAPNPELDPIATLRAALTTYSALRRGSLLAGGMDLASAVEVYLDRPGAVVDVSAPIDAEHFDAATQQARVWLMGTGAMTLGDIDRSAPALARDVLRAAGGTIERAAWPLVPASRAKHGTDSGYFTHRRLGIPYCDACRKAHTRYNNDYRRDAGREDSR